MHNEVKECYLFIFKLYYAYAPLSTELIYIVKIHNTLITINCDTYFIFCIFSFKLFGADCIIPCFGEQYILVYFYFVVLR